MNVPMSAAEIFRRYNLAENLHDSVGTMQLVASDLYVEVNGLSQVASSDDDAEAMDELYEAYPDYKREILEIIEAGDRATVLWRMTGTPRQALIDMLAPLDVRGVSVVTGNGQVLTRASLFVESTALSSLLAKAKSVRDEVVGE
ncbi:snoaL-like domain protein [mine drainage metagenome]|uniref:SnoaL-like domain protein n=1 Tax=mine drainage metagenome TaxID=410659 RepID=A0A1J5QRI4_9ZZZZ